MECVDEELNSYYYLRIAAWLKDLNICIDKDTKTSTTNLKLVNYIKYYISKY